MITPANQSPSSAPTDEEQSKSNRKKSTWTSRLVVTAVAVTATALFILIAEIAVLANETIKERIWRSNLQELERAAIEKFSPGFIDKIKSLDLDKSRLFKRLALSHEDEIKILSYLEENFDISPEQLEEILKGAHVRLDDNGQTYENWLSSIEARSSLSSHSSDTTQYRMRGSFIKELLFSRMTEKSHDGMETAYTWFQLENHPVSFGHMIRHMLDYIKYRVTSKNQGPYGNSHVTDQAPLILKSKKARSESTPITNSPSAHSIFNLPEVEEKVEI